MLYHKGLFFILLAVSVTQVWGALKCGPGRRCTCLPTRGIISCVNLGLYQMPNLRYNKASGYTTLDLRDNRIQSVGNFDMSRYNSVDLRGNPILSCEGLPKNIVVTDQCPTRIGFGREDNLLLDVQQDIVTESRNNINDDNMVKNPQPLQPPDSNTRTTSADEQPISTLGVETVDNRSGKMVVVVISASGAGGLGVLITVIITIIVQLHKKGILTPCCEGFINRIYCRNSANRPPSIEMQDLSHGDVEGYIYPLNHQSRPLPPIPPIPPVDVYGNINAVPGNPPHTSGNALTHPISPEEVEEAMHVDELPSNPLPRPTPPINCDTIGSASIQCLHADLSLRPSSEGPILVSRQDRRARVAASRDIMNRPPRKQNCHGPRTPRVTVTTQSISRPNAVHHGPLKRSKDLTVSESYEPRAKNMKYN